MLLQAPVTNPKQISWKIENSFSSSSRDLATYRDVAYKHLRALKDRLSQFRNGQTNKQELLDYLQGFL